MFAVITLLVFVSTFSDGAVPLSKGQPGFVYREASIAAPVHFDVYIDEICGDSLRAWPKVLQVADHYGPDKLKLTVHEFALPYHRNAFYASKGAFIAARFNQSMAFKWIQKTLENLEVFKGAATLNKSDDDIVQMLAHQAVEMGIDNSTFYSLFHNSSIESEARLAWKYGASRRVAETPTFMLNDVVVGYWIDSHLNLSDWRHKIDPLLGLTPPTTPTPNPPADNTPCPPSQGINAIPGILTIVMATWISLFYVHG